jgi:FkbM family methyltransferase
MKYIFLGVDNQQIKCEVSKDVEYFFSKEEFPLKFQTLSLLDKSIKYETEIFPGMWAIFPQFRDLNARIMTKSGIVLKEYKYTYDDEDLRLYEFWDLFAKYNKDSIGLILGSGNGLWGEWVSPIHQNNIRCHLIEGSSIIFEELKENYKTYNNFNLHNIIISSEGGDCDFYDLGEIENSTLNVEYFKTLSPSVSIGLPEKKPTISLNDFLKNHPNINWIRMDLEGIDFKLILSINEENLKNIKMVQYEHLFLTEEKLSKVDFFMMKNGFDKKIVFDIDTIYLKNNIQ